MRHSVLGIAAVMLMLLTLLGGYFNIPLWRIRATSRMNGR